MSEETTNQEETLQETVEKQAEVQTEAPQDDSPKNVSVDDDGTIKVDLRKQPETNQENAVQEQSTDEIPVRNESATSEGVQEQNIEATNEEPSGESATDNNESEVLELVTEEPEEKEATLADKIKDIPNKLKEQEESVSNTRELPDNVDKLISFMEETGGTLADYVALNKDYSAMEDMEILREHYRKNKPHLDESEINFLIEDSFSYDEEIDEERDIKRKKLALKESIAEAKSSLSNLKSKYYDDLKLSSKLTPEQVEAVEFYNSYKEEQEAVQQQSQQQRNVFEQKTDQLFAENFKGFEYKVGEKKYRFNVKDVNNVKSSQSDINSLVSKFVNDNNEMSDAAGYHKALFTAMNADSIANHFYEQGKADAIKKQMAESKNIDMGLRGTHEAVTTDSGVKIRAVAGDDSSRLRIKMKQ